MQYRIPQLPIDFEIETKQILRKVISANTALAEMKGAARSIPNEGILISTLSLQEAKDSSAIENIITTHDELFQVDVFKKEYKTMASKEVFNYVEALQWGFETVKRHGILTNNHIIQIQSILERNDAGFRKVPGTELKSEQTGETVYVPPQSNMEIIEHMRNLEDFINNNSLCNWDPLIKVAFIHHQFESIHPFYDGNGRTGRILNILYLVKEGLLNLPILYLSRYINHHKSDYYRLLQEVRLQNNWQDWVLFILDGIEVTSLQTITLIEGIKIVMQKVKHRLRTELPKIYSQDLLNNLFKHPYTKIEFVMEELNVSRPTATRYLDELTRLNIVQKHQLGKANFYLNHELVDLLINNATTQA